MTPDLKTLDAFFRTPEQAELGVEHSEETYWRAMEQVTAAVGHAPDEAMRELDERDYALLAAGFRTGVNSVLAVMEHEAGQ